MRFSCVLKLSINQKNKHFDPNSSLHFLAVFILNTVLKESGLYEQRPMNHEQRLYEQCLIFQLILDNTAVQLSVLVLLCQPYIASEILPLD